MMYVLCLDIQTNRHPNRDYYFILFTKIPEVFSFHFLTVKQISYFKSKRCDDSPSCTNDTPYYLIYFLYKTYMKY